MTRYDPHPDPLAALREHEKRVQAAQAAVTDLCEFAVHQAAITLRSFQLSLGAQEDLAPEDATRVNDQLAQDYFTKLAHELDKIAGQINEAVAEQEPAATSPTVFNFTRRAKEAQR